MSTISSDSRALLRSLLLSPSFPFRPSLCLSLPPLLPLPSLSHTRLELSWEQVWSHLWMQTTTDVIINRSKASQPMTACLNFCRNLRLKTNEWKSLKHFNRLAMVSIGFDWIQLVSIPIDNYCYHLFRTYSWLKSQCQSYRSQWCQSYQSYRNIVMSFHFYHYFKHWSEFPKAVIGVSLGVSRC